MSNVMISAEELAGLRQNADLYRLLAERSPLPVVMTTLGTSEVIFSNKEADDLFNKGMPAKGRIALEFYENPEDRMVLLTKLKAQGIVRNHHMRMRRSDDTIGDFLFSMVPVKLESGAGFLYTYVLDVSERMVAERALSAKNEQMRMILDNVVEGLLTIGKSGVVLGDPSATVERWLGRLNAGASFGQALEAVDPTAAAWWSVAWEAVTDGVFPLDVALDQLPRLFHVDDRAIQLSVRPIGPVSDDVVPERFLVILTDISERLAREKAESEQKETFALFERLMRDKSSVVDFLAEGGSIVERLAPPDCAAFRRDVHTLKGLSATFGVQSVADACHAFETALAEDPDEALAGAGLQHILERWRRMVAQAQGFLEQQSHDDVDVSAADLDGLAAAVARGAPRYELAQLVTALRDPPVRRRLARMAQQASALAARLGKGDVIVDVDDGGLRLPREPWSELWAALGHVLRNAVDHGLEDVDERRASGKPHQGRIRLVAKSVEDAIVIEVHDDGRGIDWDRVRARAQGLGLPHESHADLEAALFADGLSTREEATEVSGRGVGTAAFLAAVRDLGGALEVRSTLGEGTCFRAVFPRDASKASTSASSSTASSTTASAPLG